MFEDMYGTIPQESREGMGYYAQLEKTISNENVEETGSGNCPYGLDALLRRRLE